MYGSEILYNGREQNDFEKIHLSYLKNMRETDDRQLSVILFYVYK